MDMKFFGILVVLPLALAGQFLGDYDGHHVKGKKVGTKRGASKE